MAVRFLQRRTMWWPTWLGWLVLGLLVMVPPLLWWFRGESFLSVTQRVPANVLVVEGWISNEGIRESAAEFRLGGYGYIVATGGLTGESWQKKRWNYAEEAEEQLLRLGIPRDQLILASSRETGSSRTHEMALSVWHALNASHIQPANINVFTRGPHARRSRMVFSKVFQQQCQVGVISWNPENPDTKWWHSSHRAEEMIKETVGYLFELLFDSGRSVTQPTSSSSLVSGF